MPNLSDPKFVTPTEEAILMVLCKHRELGLYNLHVLERINEVNQRFGRKKVSPGTFYPTVKRLEVEGLIEGFCKELVLPDQLPGVRRRYLKITPSGEEVLRVSNQYRKMLSEGKFTEEKKEQLKLEPI